MMNLQATPPGTARLNVPLLAKLVLAEIADRRGMSDQALMVELIFGAATHELARELDNTAARKAIDDTTL